MWGIAGVGMIGLVMNDAELVKWALEGLEVKIPKQFLKDNDGGAIQGKNKQEVGFYAQLNHAFSPDGYYTEGPYYQRYAMYPFLIFAQSLSNKRPDLNIFKYRDNLLIKAVYALVNQTNAKGEFFPFNDAQKGMSLSSRELVNALSMAYALGGKDKRLLPFIEAQGRVPLNEYGLLAAKAIKEGFKTGNTLKSVELKDGAHGDEGAIGILRNGGLTLVMKYAKHGMGHGHFDRLGYLLFDKGKEVIQDYGAARWVNLEHKDGGGYLKENKTWAKQTIAHNTLVINQESQFKAQVSDAEKYHGTPYYFDASNPKIQIVSAKEHKAYPNVLMQRTMCLLDLENLERPLLLDIFSVQNSSEATYDLPLYYMGELLKVNQEYRTKTILKPIGDKYGYQHLWTEAESTPQGDNLQMTWFNKGKFYSLTSTLNPSDRIFLTRIGANDPNFNLRRDPGLIQRRIAKNTTFVNLIETHGRYDYASEIPVNSFSSVRSLELIHQSEDYSVVAFELTNDSKFIFSISLNDTNKTKRHVVEFADKSKLEWRGPYTFKQLTNLKNEKK